MTAIGGRTSAFGLTGIVAQFGTVGRGVMFVRMQQHRHPVMDRSDCLIAVGHDTRINRAPFDAFAPEGCAFEQCDFRGQTLDRRFQPLFYSRRRSVFRECRFDEADLRGRLTAA